MKKPPIILAAMLFVGGLMAGPVAALPNPVPNDAIFEAIDHCKAILLGSELPSKLLSDGWTDVSSLFDDDPNVTEAQRKKAPISTAFERGNVYIILGTVFYGNNRDRPQNSCSVSARTFEASSVVTKNAMTNFSLKRIDSSNAVDPVAGVSFSFGDKNPDNPEKSLLVVTMAMPPKILE